MNDPTAFNDKRAEVYDERILTHIPGYEVLHALTETILAAELPEQASVLVAGVGTGTEITAWAPKHPGWNFVGIDPSEAMLQKAREKLAHAALENRAVLHVGAVENLPPDPFDAATLVLVLHFIPDDGQKAALMSALAERLKPGAPLVLATMFGDPETTRYKRLIALAQRWAMDHGMDPEKAAELCDPSRKDLHAVPEERLKALFREAGLIDMQRVYQALSIGVWLARAPR